MRLGPVVGLVPVEIEVVEVHGAYRARRAERGSPSI
jgi:hypothetical protein